MSRTPPYLLFLTALCVLATTALGQEVPDVSPEQAAEAVSALVASRGTAGSAAIGAMLSSIVTLVVFVVRRLGLLEAMPPRVLPWFAVALAMVGEIAVVLAAGVPVGPALLQGLLLGSSAVGFWELVGKNLVKSPKQAAEEAAP